MGWPHRHFGDLAKRDDRVLVAVAIDGELGAPEICRARWAASRTRSKRFGSCRRNLRRSRAPWLGSPEIQCSGQARTPTGRALPCQCKRLWRDGKEGVAHAEARRRGEVTLWPGAQRQFDQA
jgi:hypothetical protein